MEHKYQNGSITVYFSFITILLIALIGSLLESARYSSMQVRMKQATYAAAESLLSCYDLELFSEYGLLYYNDSSKLLTDIYLERFFIPECDFNYGKISKYPQLLRVESPYIELGEGYRGTAAGGEDFVKQVLSLMKYKEVAEIAQTIKNLISGVENADKMMENSDRNQKEFDSTDWQQRADELERINQNIEDDDEYKPAFDGKVNEDVNSSVNSSFIGDIENLIGRAITSVVIPQKEVSSKQINKNFLWWSFDKGKTDTYLESLIDKVLFSEYVFSYFGNLINPSSHSLDYEQEYILYGFNSDSLNLSLTLGKIFVIREGMNLISILTDKELYGQAEVFAELLVGWTGIVPLVYAVQLLAETAWAAGESILDVRALAEGYKIPFYKNANTFDTTLAGCIGQVFSGEMATGDKSGIGYNMYMRLLFTFAGDDIVRRTMEMIEVNMREEDSLFSFENLYYGFSINSGGYMRALFVPAYSYFTNQKSRYDLSTTVKAKY